MASVSHNELRKTQTDAEHSNTEIHFSYKTYIFKLILFGVQGPDLI